MQNIDVNKIAEYFYNTITLQDLLKFVIVYLLIVWFALLIWVIRDITNRSKNLFLLIFSIFIILFLWPLWIFIYLIIRPNISIFEKSYETIEENLDLFNQIIEEKAEQLELETHCFNCWDLIKNEFNFCPNCKEKLKTECSSCKKTIQINWKNCPFCWASHENEKHIVIEKTKKTKS